MSKKVGIIIFARQSSKRLPNKVLHRFGTEELILHVFKRAKRSKIKNIVFAISDDKSDDMLASYLTDNGMNIFRGSLENVYERALNCSRFFQLSHFFRVCGDRLFLNHDCINRFYEILKRDEGIDFITNVSGKIPKGVTTELISTDLLIRYQKKINKLEKEHLTSIFYKNLEHINHRVYKESNVIRNLMDLTVDTKEDIARFNNYRTLIKKDFLNISLEDLMELKSKHEA